MTEIQDKISKLLLEDIVQSDSSKRGDKVRVYEDFMNACRIDAEIKRIDAMVKRDSRWFRLCR